MTQSSATERYGRLSELDRSFDLMFWQSQHPKARMDATWELVIHAYRVKGLEVRRLRLQRSVEKFQRQERQVSDRRRIRRDSTL